MGRRKAICWFSYLRGQVLLHNYVSFTNHRRTCKKSNHCWNANQLACATLLPFVYGAAPRVTIQNWIWNEISWSGRGRASNSPQGQAKRKAANQNSGWMFVLQRWKQPKHQSPMQEQQQTELNSTLSHCLALGGRSNARERRRNGFWRVWLWLTRIMYHKQISTRQRLSGHYDRGTFQTRRTKLEQQQSYAYLPAVWCEHNGSVHTLTTKTMFVIGRQDNIVLHSEKGEGSDAPSRLFPRVGERLRVGYL